MNRIFVGITSLVFCLLLTGCGGSGGGGGPSSPVLEIPPEQALLSILDSWKNVGGARLNLVKKTLEQVATETTVTSEPSYGTITFKDLGSDESWVFRVIDIQKPSSLQANVVCRYNFKNLEDGQLKINFRLIKIEGIWRLDDVLVEEIPWVYVTETGIEGIVTDAQTGQPIEGALVYISGTNYSTRTDSDGLYSFQNLPKGTYTLLITRDGYVIKTITGVVVS